MRETCATSGRVSREIARKSSIHPLPDLANFSPRFGGSCAIFLTLNGPIPTLFRSFCDENVDFFDLGEHFFLVVSSSVFLHFSLFLLIFSPEKGGPIDSPRHCRFNGVFFHPKRTNFHPISITLSLEIHFFQF